jgi:putative methyltransferase (TIGR04325 family)
MFLKPLKNLRNKIFAKEEESILSECGWFGDYNSWAEASKVSVGYNSDKILIKVAEATQTVLRGDAEFERDSVLFYEKEYQFHILTALLWIALNNNKHLSVLDFGGALGSTYIQNRVFLDKLNVNWNIVEQQNFVDAGKQLFQNGRLRFYNTVDECMQHQSPQLVLLSSVLAYLPAPYELLDEIFKLNLEYLILDKHPLIEAQNDRLTVQTVPPSIYDASYPSWFFSKKKFYAFLSSKYDIVYEHNCGVANNLGANFHCIVARLK